MSTIRTIEIPPNGRGIPAGTWIEWPSLRAWLVEEKFTDIEKTLRKSIEGPALLTTETVVR